MAGNVRFIVEYAGNRQGGWTVGDPVTMFVDPKDAGDFHLWIRARGSRAGVGGGGYSDFGLSHGGPEVL